MRKSEKLQQEIYNIEYKEYTKYRLDNWRISYLRRIFELLEMGEKDVTKGTFLDIGVGGQDTPSLKWRGKDIGASE